MDIILYGEPVPAEGATSQRFTENLYLIFHHYFIYPVFHQVKKGTKLSHTYMSTAFER